MLNLFKEIYTHRKLAFSRRFLPFTLFIVFGLVIGLFNRSWWFSGRLLPISLSMAWAIFTGCLFISGKFLMPFERKRLKKIYSNIVQLNWIDAQCLLEQQSPWATPTYKIQRDLLLAILFKNKGLMFESHELLKKLTAKSLMLTEYNSVRLAIAALFIDVGNFREAMFTFDNIDHLNVIGSQNKAQYAIIGSRLAEISNDFKTSKTKLEQALDDVSIESEKRAFIYHNLARLEDAQNNVNAACSYYEQAWSLLKEGENFQQISITAGNIILLNARASNIKKALNLLFEFELLVDMENKNQLLEFNNCRIVLARQINDKDLLIDAYKTSSEIIEPKLTEDEQFLFFISNLRMHLNDRVDFENHLVKTMQILLNAKKINLLDVLSSYKEVLGVIRQVLNHGMRSDLLAYHGWISLQYIQLEEAIDDKLRMVPASLPSYLEKWLMFKLELIKIKFNFSKLGISKQAMDSLFATLKEVRNIWEDKENSVGSIKALMILLDEYVAYSKLTNDVRFKKDFGAIAHSTLEQVENLLQKTWQQPEMHEYTAMLAWFWFEIFGDKQKAEFWLEKFESKKNSLNHFAIWYQERYFKTKQWLCSVDISA